MNRILELRKAAKLNQEDLAKFAGCSQKSLSNYENGTRKIPYDVLKKLSTAFNCSPEYLLGESDTKSPAASGSEAKSDSVIPPPSTEDQALFKRLQEANTLFLSLDDAGKAQALAYLQFLAQQQASSPDAQD